MVRRTDGRAAAHDVRGAGQGRALDEVDIIKTMRVPLAVVNGAQDVFVNPDTSRPFPMRRLGRCSATACPALATRPPARPDAFNPLFARFLATLG